MAKDGRKGKGVSLAKGPVAIVGLVLLAFGITGLIFGGHGFDSNPVDGTINAKRWLGIEGNGWTNLLFAGAGALLVFGAPLHWGAKTLSLIVGLVLGAASVIALVDGDDVFGIFAANGPTKLAWGAASGVLLVLSLLPRVGGRDEDGDRARHGGARMRRREAHLDDPRYDEREVGRTRRAVEPDSGSVRAGGPGRSRDRL